MSLVAWVQLVGLYGYDGSLCKKTSSDETILASAFPLYGLNCKYKVQN